MPGHKPHLTFWQMWNMSFGFFGIQFGWGLQMGNMSAIYEYLGANESQLPLLRLPAPLTVVIVQPIIGHMTDRTRGAFGRRRPYFLGSPVLSSVALFVMPHKRGFVDGCRLALGAGRIGEHQHGTFPRVRCRHAAGRAAHRRLRHAVRLPLAQARLSARTFLGGCKVIELTSGPVSHIRYREPLSSHSPPAQWSFSFAFFGTPIGLSH